MFPLMVQVIGSASKSEVMKTMLLKQYLVQSYVLEFPDIARHLCANNRRLPETPIENYHSVLKHYIPNTMSNSTIEHYHRASCLVKPATEARRSLSTALLDTDEVRFKHFPRAPSS